NNNKQLPTNKNAKKRKLEQSASNALTAFLSSPVKKQNFNNYSSPLKNNEQNFNSSKLENNNQQLQNNQQFENNQQQEEDELLEQVKAAPPTAPQVLSITAVVCTIGGPNDMTPDFQT